MAAELLSLFQTKSVSWKWVELLLKLESDSLLWYVYSMYAKQSKIEKLARSYRYENNSERTVNWFTDDFFPMFLILECIFNITFRKWVM